MDFQVSQLELLSTLNKQISRSDRVKCLDGTYADSIGNYESVLREDLKRSEVKNSDKCRVCEKLNNSPSTFWTDRVEIGGTKVEFSNEESKEIDEYFDNKLVKDLNGEEIKLAIALQASENENVDSIKYNNESNSLEIEHKEEVKLFSIFGIKTNVKTQVDSQGNIEEKFPW